MYYDIIELRKSILPKRSVPMSGSQIYLTLSRTGASYTLGQDSMNPKWVDAYHMFQLLQERGDWHRVMPGEPLPEDMLVGATKAQLEHLIPMVVLTGDQLVFNGIIDMDADPQFVAIMWVLSWYWHIHMGGPRPLSRPEYRNKVSPIKGISPDFICPVCGRIYEPPAHFIKIAAMYRAWCKWLVRHGRDYHQY
jgi:hypothetical protein